MFEGTKISFHRRHVSATILSIEFEIALLPNPLYVSFNTRVTTKYFFDH